MREQAWQKMSPQTRQWWRRLVSVKGFSHLAHARTTASSTHRPDTVSWLCTMLVGDHTLEVTDAFDTDRSRPSSSDMVECRGAAEADDDAAALTERSTRAERGTGGGRTHMLSEAGVLLVKRLLSWSQASSGARGEAGDGTGERPRGEGRPPAAVERCSRASDPRKCGSI